MLTNNCTLKYRNSGTLNSRLLNLKFNNKLGLEIARIARKTKTSKGTKVEKVGKVGNVNVKCSCLVLAMLAINSQPRSRPHRAGGSWAQRPVRSAGGWP